MLGCVSGIRQVIGVNFPAGTWMSVTTWMRRVTVQQHRPQGRNPGSCPPTPPAGVRRPGAGHGGAWWLLQPLGPPGAARASARAAGPGPAALGSAASSRLCQGD